MNDKSLSLPLLALARDKGRFDRFKYSAGFRKGELLLISKKEDILGRKDTVMFMVDPYVEDHAYIKEYCQTHNIKLVRV